MKNIVIAGLIILQLFITVTVFAAEKNNTSATCYMDFSMKGWSMEIVNGKGTFTEVLNIDEIFGGYIAAEAHAGAVKSAQASVYTKGEISLALTGTGRGINIGIDFGKLEISRRTK